MDARVTLLLVLTTALSIAGCNKGEGSGLPFQTVGKQPDVAPVMLNKELPFRYPPALYAQKVQGNVTLRIFIDRERGDIGVHCARFSGDERISRAQVRAGEDSGPASAGVNSVTGVLQASR